MDYRRIRDYLRPFHGEPQLIPFDRHAVYEGFLSPEDCQGVIDRAEAYAAKHGWTLNRHVAYATTDIPTDISCKTSQHSNSGIYC